MRIKNPHYGGCTGWVKNAVKVDKSEIIDE
jgi:hypothetical protein